MAILTQHGWYVPDDPEQLPPSHREEVSLPVTQPEAPEAFVPDTGEWLSKVASPTTVTEIKVKRKRNIGTRGAS